MKLDATDKTEEPCSVGWQDGFLGVLAGSGAGLCCVGPVVFGVLGFSGVASALAALPIFYHVVLQWVAVAILAGAWGLFLYKIRRVPKPRRWTITSVATGLILVAASLYVIRSWVTHGLL